jgi:hypothetical protein
MGKRLIYAEDALDLIDQNRAFMSDVGRIHAKNAVNEAPTVEQKKGRWDENGRCTNCGGHAPYWCMASTYYKSPFCFECGADMRGEEDGN